MIIAVDGPAASGKGTISRRIAEKYGLKYLDTGSLYRAVARDVLAADGDLRDTIQTSETARQLDANSLEDPALRENGVGEAASIVANIPEVRAALLDFQRAFAEGPPGAVLDGRDIGTIVCPNADVKLFVTASVEERARRRYLELKAQDSKVREEEILENIKKRDERDRSREIAPLKVAADAHLLDTTNLDIEAAFKAAVEHIDAMIGRTGCVS